MQTGRAGAESLSAADIQTLCLLDAFGALIANTDRHHGNVSLLLPTSTVRARKWLI